MLRELVHEHTGVYTCAYVHCEAAITNSALWSRYFGSLYRGVRRQITCHFGGMSSHFDVIWPCLCVYLCSLVSF